VDALRHCPSGAVFRNLPLHSTLPGGTSPRRKRMLRIHGSARSRATRTLWLAEELGLKYEHNDIAPRSPGTRTPEYLALNPNARVPTIEDDGLVLSESMAINLYLAKKHGKLYPSGAQNEALAWQWCFWETDRLDRQ